MRAEHGGLLLVTWHGQSLIPVLYARGRRYIGLVSLSRDGDLLAECFRRLGWRTVRGSTSRGGIRAAKALINALTGASGKHNVLAMTPDGPRGPARKVQPGAIFLAQKSGKPLVPVGIAVDQAWHANSWDRFLVPKPFSRTVWLYGDPILVDPDAEIPVVCLQVEEAINTLEAEAASALSTRTTVTREAITRPVPRSLHREQDSESIGESH